MENQKSSTVYFLAAVIVLLLGTTAYLYLSKSKVETRIITVTDEKAFLQRELDLAKSELDAATQSTNKLSADLQAKEIELKQKINALQTALNKGKLTEAELTNARNEITQLRRNVDRYTIEIEKLKTENIKLNFDNTVLKTNVDEANKTNALLNEENRTLNFRVAAAQALKIQMIKAEPVRIRNNGREAKVSRAKNAYRVNFNFNLRENEFSLPGERDVYVQVYQPDGSLYVANDGNATFMTSDDNEIMYSSISRINYQPGNNLYSISFEKNSDFSPGLYKAIFYCDGFLMGSTEFTLK